MAGLVLVLVMALAVTRYIFKKLHINVDSWMETAFIGFYSGVIGAIIFALGVAALSTS